LAVSVRGKQLKASIASANVRNFILLFLLFRNMNILLPEGNFLMAQAALNYSGKIQITASLFF